MEGMLERLMGRWKGKGGQEEGRKGRVDGGMEQSANYLRRGQVSEPLLVDQPEEAGP